MYVEIHSFESLEKLTLLKKLYGKSFNWTDLFSINFFIILSIIQLLYVKTNFLENLKQSFLFCLQLQSGVPLPSPTSLRRKILIKNKKKHFKAAPAASTATTTGSSQGEQFQDGGTIDDSKAKTSEDAGGKAEAAPSDEESEVKQTASTI